MSVLATEYAQADPTYVAKTAVRYTLSASPLTSTDRLPRDLRRTIPATALSRVMVNVDGEVCVEIDTINHVCADVSKPPSLAISKHFSY